MGSGGRGGEMGCGRAGAAEEVNHWEEAGDDPVDGRWTGCGRAGAATFAHGRRLEMEAARYEWG